MYIYIPVMLALSAWLRASPHVGAEPLRVTLDARPGAVGYFCIQAESDVGGWQRTCFSRDPGQLSVYQTWMTLEAGAWQLSLRVGTEGRILARERVEVTSRDPAIN